MSNKLLTLNRIIASKHLFIKANLVTFIKVHHYLRSNMTSETLLAKANIQIFN